jgi:hypothetical protein
MRYLITGGTGLIGRALINTLISESNKHRITILTRNPSRAKTILPDTIEQITSLTQRLIDKTDIVINLAGEPIANKRWSAKQKQKICNSRWQLTASLSDFIQQSNNPPALFISGSAIGIYGRQSANVSIDEDYQQYHAEFTHEVCAKWEQLAINAASQHTRVVLLRTGIVLSQRGGALAKMIKPFQLGLGGKIANGQQIMSWIHYQDVIAAILHIQNTQQITGAVNITAPTPVSNAEFSQALAKVLHRPCFFTTPALILQCLFGEMADLLLYGQQVIPRKLLDTGFKFQFNTIDSALDDLLAKR